ncbi:MAG: response regulator transcription factor [Clostridiales bacterium]|nr:response regulator transcription factor [Clostridiales bacterium]
MYRIFIIEDDEVITGALSAHLERWGFEASGINDFRNVLTECMAYDPHLVLLDISLPFFDGYHWCREIRNISKVPIIFISSAAENMNILMALNAGADDFIAKPFDLAVLLAKVQAMLRRTYDFSDKSSLLTHGDLLLNASDSTLSYHGEKIDLTKNENRILTVLLEHSGEIVSRETLMTRLWESDAYVDENTLTVNVTRLRKRLEALGVKGLIQTKKGMGYIIK